MLDEAFGISVNQITVPKKIINPTMAEEDDFEKLTLNNDDILYKDFRGLMIRDVGLRANAKQAEIVQIMNAEKSYNLEEVKE